MAGNCFLLELTRPVYGSTPSYDTPSYLTLSEERKKRTNYQLHFIYLIFFLRRVPTLSRTQRR